MTRKFFHRFILLALAFSAGVGSVRAQRIFWEPSHGTLGFGKTTELNLVFEDCTPQNDVTLPTVPQLTFGRPSVSQQTTINFGQNSSRVVMAYPVRPTGREDVVIPAFDVRTNRGKIAVGEVRFTVGDATVGQSGLNVSDVLTGLLRPARLSVWAGEVVDLEYVLLASPRFRCEIASAPDWKPAGVFTEPFGEFENVESPVNGERRVGARYRSRLVATTAGTLQLAPVRQTINVQTGERSGFIFAQPRVESFSISSDQPELTVRALPSPAPAGFTGAVGDFKLESKIVPETARVGEPITWTVTLRGVGNWPANPALPAREVSADFQVVQPQGRETMDEGRLFSGSITEDAVLVPTRAGTYTIGPVNFAWFDTASGTFRDAPIPAVKVTILPAINATPTPPPTDGTSGNAANPSAGGNDTMTRPLPPDLAAPGSLPRDPLTTGSSGTAPGKTPVWWWFIFAFAPPGIVWAVFAWRLMIRSDHYLVRRNAQHAILRLLEPYRRSNTAPDVDALRVWRDLAARLWNVERATPIDDDLASALQRVSGAPRPDDWTTLWREAEIGIFGAAGAVAPDWAARACEAARTLRLRREAPPVPIQARFWTPAPSTIAIVIMALLVFVPSATRASDAGARAYREGNFAAARTAWRMEVANHPRDWAARNNLALASAQLDDWAEATAHWTAAFLLNPREPSIRANLRLALTHMDGVDPEIRRLVEGSWLDGAVTILSPGEWQTLFFAGGIAIAVALTLLVTTLYSARGRRWRIVAGYTLFSLGAIDTVAGLAGKMLYGPLAEPDAGLIAKATELHSIPTDLAEHQQTSPIASGSVVVVQNTFQLGWQRVEAPHMSGGWLRREAIIPFFSAPPAKKAADQTL